MNLPLSLLGTKDLRNQVVSDVERIFNLASNQGLVPVTLAVGPIFIELAAAHSVISTYKIEDWESHVGNNPCFISELFAKHKKKLLDSSLQKDGLIRLDEKTGATIFFDPEEEYMNLTCVDRTKKAKDNEPSSGDGYLLRSFRYDPEKILPDYKFEN